MACHVEDFDLASTDNLAGKYFMHPHAFAPNRCAVVQLPQHSTFQEAIGSRRRNAALVFISLWAFAAGARETETPAAPPPSPQELAEEKHNPFADQVTVLHFGETLATGAPEDIRHNERVREIYLGTA